MSTSASGPISKNCALASRNSAVLAAPIQPVSLGQSNGFIDRILAFPHGALQVAAFDAVLHADIARVVFAINKRCAVALADVGQLAQRNLLSIRRADQQIADLVRAAAELRLHAHHQIEQLLALDDLGHRLSADRRRDHGFHIGNVDSVARNLVAVHIDQQARLAKLAHHGQVR